MTFGGLATAMNMKVPSFLIICSIALVMSSAIAILLVTLLTLLRNSVNLHMKMLIVLIGSLSILQTEAIRFGESDVYIRENDTPRSIAIERTQAYLSNPVSITVYVTTLDQYKLQEHKTHGCNLSLVNLQIDESRDDPAEDSDLLVREFNLTFEVDVYQLTIDLQVHDDNLSEREEKFILYTNYTTAPLDRCALAVSIIDDDWLLFNFNFDHRLIIREDINVYSNLLIVKTGQNEPNVTIQIKTWGHSDEVYNILQMDYLFTSDSSEIDIPIAVYDDDVLNGERRFFIYIPALSLVNLGGLHAMEVIPHHIEAYIQDDEVAIVGFQNNSQIMLQEGGRSAKVCVGFDISMENVSIEDSVYIRIDITSKTMNPGSGYDLTSQPLLTEGIHISSFIQKDCVDIFSVYDTNLEDSVYFLSLTVSDSTVSTAIVLDHQANLTVYTSDLHGIFYIREPMNITTGLGKTAFFPCTYRGSSVNPLWNISYADGTSRFVSTTRLPVKLQSNGTGIIINDVDKSHNMTGYSCIFQAFDQDKIVLVSSSIGILTVLESVIFSFHVNTNISYMFEGDIPPRIAVLKTGYSRDTHMLNVLLKVFTDGISQEERLNLWFYPSTTKRNITIPQNPFANDSYPERLSRIHVEILEVHVDGMDSGATIEVTPPLQILVYDNDFNVGFTQETYIMDAESSSDICLAVFGLNSTDIHPSQSIHLTLHLSQLDSDIILSDEVTLTSDSISECITVMYNHTKKCTENEKNVTIMAEWRESEEKNVTFSRQEATIIITTTITADCLEPTDDPSNLTIAIIIIVCLCTAIVILLLCLIVNIFRCCRKVKIERTSRDSNVVTNVT